MSAKVTPWFPADVIPVYSGWYERLWSHFPHNQKAYSNDYWDGKTWWLGASDDHKFCEGAMDRPWRGLAEKP